MAAISVPLGACSRAHPNHSSTSRPGSIPIPIRCRVFLPICSPVCRSRLPPPQSRQPRRAPMALTPPTRSCPRRARRFCCPWSPGWSGHAAPPLSRRPMPSTPVPRPLPDTRSTLSARSTRAAVPGWSSSAIPTIPTAGCTPGPLCSILPRTCAVAAACSWSTRRSWMSGRRTRVSAADVSCGNVVVLRSFGKFFGLAGIRLGFALAAPALAVRLGAALGPWAVSGPALAVGGKALADTAWRAADAAAARKGGEAARYDSRQPRSRHRRRHKLVPAGANGGS